jgi:hypothetical protein
LYSTARRAIASPTKPVAPYNKKADDMRFSPVLFDHR